MELLATTRKPFRLINKAIRLDSMVEMESTMRKDKLSFAAKGTIKAKAASEFEDLELIDDNEVETFSKLVKAYMERKNLTSKDIYRNSLINRKLFSALNVNDDYIPSKETAIMYCFALKLSIKEATRLLTSAGYALYEYSNFDRIIKYFLEHNLYNIDKLNDTLYLYTNRCIGYH